MTNRAVEFAVNHPKATLGVLVLVTGLFAAQFPKVRTDTDPKHMLPATSEVRVYNDQVETQFALHADVLVLGVVNEGGVFNRETLARVHRLTERVLETPGVVAEDVISFATADDVRAEGVNLYAQPLMAKAPQTDAAVQALRRAVMDNPLFVGRLVGADETATAIYVPLQKGANGKAVSDRLRALAREVAGEAPSGDRFYVAGDPVARDTFGAEMFKQMGLFSPLAGMVMFVALWLMFRNLTLVMANMGVAMMAIIWAMGATIGLGIPIHIMSSMSPVFLMAISTDSVHLFNEFYFRFKELGDRRQAILETMRAVGRPLLYTDLTTAVGFAALATGHIIPVKVFGLLVAFGTLVILLASFTLIPAVLMLIPEAKLARLTVSEDLTESRLSRWLWRLGEVSIRRRGLVVGVGVGLLALSAVGISRIRVNNNMVAWFKPRSEIRRADAELNRRLGGTATAYLVAAGQKDGDMQRPEVQRYLEGLGRYLEQSPVVGKATSVADIVKRVSRVLHEDDPAHEVLPDTKQAVAQYLLLFSMAAKPRDLNNFVDLPFRQANLWLQLKTWDADAMQEVLARAKAYQARHPLPGMSFKPAGIAYFNKVWNDEVLWGMLYGFLWSAVLVGGLMCLAFRSLRWGLVAVLPLLFTVAVSYGFIGFIGKDFDMPISVLSTLTLGLATDFAVHFIGRFRQRRAELDGNPPLDEVLLWTVARPGKGIVRNAILFALGFSVMMFAALTPYITVGLFMAAIMLLSGLTTLLYLPALVKLWERWLLPEAPRGEQEVRAQALSKEERE
jgi:predicted RND superfamily exporter protein